MSRKQDYRVTDASVFTVRPVVTEHRYQMIEEIPPEKVELGPFTKFVCRVIGLLLGFWLVGWVFSMIAG